MLIMKSGLNINGQKFLVWWLDRKTMAQTPACYEVFLDFEGQI